MAEMQPLNVGHHYRATIALSTIGAGAQTVTLTGGPYSNLALRLSDGASDVHHRINPDDDDTAAATTDPLIEARDSFGRVLDEGISMLYLYLTGTVGSLIVEAW